MKLFECQACGQLLHFENTRCERCSRRLGYLPRASDLSALEPEEQETWRALAAPRQQRFRFCANAAYDACNWLTEADSGTGFCLACRHNGIIPDLGKPGNKIAWQKIEVAKHRLFYALVRLGLPLETRAEAPEGLTFEFLADPPAEGGPKVMTGHDNGLITIALSEADDAERERRRTSMGEPYRTLLGHFRHEVGHYYWDRLVRDRGHLDACRALFGDDREDYGEALNKHYARGGPPPDWQERYVSTYATMHPWEDFAETWAHYLHVVDTLEMAGAFGVRVQPKLDESGALGAEVGFDPYAAGPIDRLVAAWLPLTFALNGLNRCMGLSDLYPFILSPPVVEKLGFIHRLVHDELS
jgi:hypothetical protein